MEMEKKIGKTNRKEFNYLIDFILPFRMMLCLYLRNSKLNIGSNTDRQERIGKEGIGVKNFQNDMFEMWK